jgi:hypothetical protein
MIDYYLKFTDQAEADSVLYRIEGAVEANEELGTEAVEGNSVANYDNIDVIGTIYRPTGEVDEEGNAIVAPLDGYHVNIRNYTDAPELEQYAVVPTIPVRVWG